VNKTVLSSLTVRLVANGTTSAGGGTIGSAGTLRVADYFDGTFSPVRLTGTVSPVGPAVPEPSGVVLLGSGLIGLAGLARRGPSRA
jgi:hypothetical protein